MVRARVLLAATAAGLMLFAGCSKSEDQAAKRQLFGSPPQITSVVVTDPSQQASPLSCDFTEIMKGRLCYLGAPPDMQEDAPITVFGKYTKAVFEVTVTDQDGIDDLLFVGASFEKPGSDFESTLVLFDDGSMNEFPQSQVDQLSGPQDCVADEFQCYCNERVKEYKVTSNDVTAGDGKFTRAAAFFAPQSKDILRDCLMLANKQAPIPIGEGGVTLSFRIDAVDREGNLDTWDSNPTVTVVSVEEQDPSFFGCTGDECGCCIFLNPFNYPSECFGKPGLYSPSLGVGVCSLFT